MFSMPGGWEFMMIIAVIAFFFGGSKALDAIKNAGKEINEVKKEVEEITDITKKL